MIRTKNKLGSTSKTTTTRVHGSFLSSLYFWEQWYIRNKVRFLYQNFTTTTTLLHNIMCVNVRALAKKLQ